MLQRCIDSFFSAASSLSVLCAEMSVRNVWREGIFELKHGCIMVLGSRAWACLASTHTQSRQAEGEGERERESMQNTNIENN